MGTFRTGILLVVTSFLGCGARVYRPPPVPAVAPVAEPGPVGAAFAADPRTPLPARIAVYAREAVVAEALAEALPGLQAVAGTHVIRRYLVDGRPRWVSPYVPAYGPPEEPLDLEALRLVAARAHCDVVVVADRGTRRTVRGNGWTVLAPLLVTNLVTPLFRVTDESYLDVSIFDVRTGYLYGEILAEDRSERGPATLYAVERAAPFEAQLVRLIDEVRAEIGDLLWHHLMTPSG